MERPNKVNEEKSRIESTRRAEARTAELRPTLKMFTVDKLYIPAEWVPHGWEYKWIRISYRDRPDYENENGCLEMGYTPVPADRHPEMSRRLTKNTMHNVDGCIVREGLMLCEIPLAINQERRDFRSRQEFERTTSLNSLKTGMGSEATMPAQVFSHQTGTNFGVGFGS